MISTHVHGVIGQAAAALPPIVMLIVLSRTSGLDVAGRFTAVAGISAAVFSVALWGMRTLVLLDRFRVHQAGSLLQARAIALLFATILVFVLAMPLGIDARLVIGLILFKACDGLIDLEFAFSQVRSEPDSAFRDFATLHTSKLLFLLVVLSSTLIGFDARAAFLASGVAAFVILAIRSIRSVPGRLFGAPFSSVRGILRDAAWFAVAVAICSVLTAAPRFALPWFYSGEAMGVVGVCLSVGTLFGMIYYTTWLRHQPRFVDQSTFVPSAMRFIVEVAVLTAIAVGLSWFVLPQLVFMIFAIDAIQFEISGRLILVGTALFFAGMCLCNLYKVTRRPWLESVAYASAFFVAGIAATVGETFRQIAALLYLAAGLMFMFGIAALRQPFRAAEQPD